MGTITFLINTTVYEKGPFDEVFDLFKNIEGWKWDEATWIPASKHNKVPLLPDNPDLDISYIPNEIFQYGYAGGEDLKLVNIAPEFTDKSVYSIVSCLANSLINEIRPSMIWAPLINAGEVYWGKNRFHIFSTTSINEKIEMDTDDYG